MEKILTIQINSKTYAPNIVQKQNSIIENNITYAPNITERIIFTDDTFYLLSNLSLQLTTQKGDNLIYGK